MSTRVLDHFIQIWDEDAKKTLALLRALPVSKYEFRPDPAGRSLGELAWHLAEVDAYMTFGIQQDGFDPGMKPPGIERPRTVEALAPGYERVHAEAVSRLRGLDPAVVERKVRFFDGTEWGVQTVLWEATLHHLMHHRGQLVLMCRLAGGKPPGLYGPNREEMAAFKEKAGT